MNHNNENMRPARDRDTNQITIDNQILFQQQKKGWLKRVKREKER